MALPWALVIATAACANANARSTPSACDVSGAPLQPNTPRAAVRVGVAPACRCRRCNTNRRLCQVVPALMLPCRPTRACGQGCTSPASLGRCAVGGGGGDAAAVAAAVVVGAQYCQRKLSSLCRCLLSVDTSAQQRKGAGRSKARGARGSQDKGRVQGGRGSGMPGARGQIPYICES